MIALCAVAYAGGTILHAAVLCYHHVLLARSVLPLRLYFPQITIENRLLPGTGLIGMTWLISTWAEQQRPFGPSGNTIFEQTRKKIFPNYFGLLLVLRGTHMRYLLSCAR